MGHRPIPKGEGEVGLLLLTGVEGVPREEAPHPRHRLPILPAAQQLRLRVAFSFLVSMVAAHTAPPSGANALQSEWFQVRLRNDDLSTAPRCFGPVVVAGMALTLKR